MPCAFLHFFDFMCVDLCLFINFFPHLQSDRPVAHKSYFFLFRFRHAFLVHLIVGVRRKCAKSLLTLRGSRLYSARLSGEGQR